MVPDVDLGTERLGPDGAHTRIHCVHVDLHKRYPVALLDSDPIRFAAKHEIFINR